MSALNLKTALKDSPKKQNRRNRSKSPATGSGMTKNRISFGNSQTLLFEKEVEDEAHKNAVWYSKGEIKSIRKDLKTSIQKGDISRGLEPYEGDMGLETKMKRLNHIRSILDLQKKQNAKGVQDDKGLQSLSRAMSSDDIRKAQKLASMDSTEAFSVYKNQNTPYMRAKNAKEYAKKTEKKPNSLLTRARKSTPNMFLQALS